MCANPSASVRPSGVRRQASGVSHALSADHGYALMREYRKKANEHLSRALEIDESGRGKTETTSTN